MADLHDALQHFAGVEWDHVPQDNDSLTQYMSACFTAGELVCNSVPAVPNGTPFSESKPHHQVHNSAKSHKDMHPSATRPQTPPSDHEALQKSWGKPVKLKQADNPLGVSLYKMAGNDRHGAWFARRSVHEGLGFDKWKRAMMCEFSVSMAVSGGPGAGAVRGIAADRRLERTTVDGVGELEVYELSAQFPGPTTPREFIAMLLNSDSCLPEKSATTLAGGEKHVPRHFMVVSKPVEHPDAPLRSGFVRGHYESVEMIREIPLTPANPKSTPDYASKLDDTANEHENRAREHATRSDPDSSSGVGAADDAELNPVEWIMVTRSDPGGGIPRFLVERGTPEAMITDMHKFLDWACSQDRIADSGEDMEKEVGISQQGAHNQEHEQGTPTTDTTSQQSAQRQKNATSREQTTSDPGMSTQSTSQGGIMTNLTDAIQAGIDSYAPATVSNLVLQRDSPAYDEKLSEDSSEASSDDSFISAEESRRLSTAPEVATDRSAENLSIASGDNSEASKDLKSRGNHEKGIVKLTKKREKLEQQLAKRRMLEENKLKQNQEKEESEANKQRDESEKKMKRTEERHRKVMEKLEAKKAKEKHKAEEKRRKKDEQNNISLVTRERDEFRSQSDLYRRENGLLREQVADLQAQNDAMAQKISKLGGQDGLSSGRDEVSHHRFSSVVSSGRGSSDSVLKKSDNETTASAS